MFEVFLREAKLAAGVSVKDGGGGGGGCAMTAWNGDGNFVVRRKWSFEWVRGILQRGRLECQDSIV
jgi:hypothetical protein